MHRDPPLQLRRGESEAARQLDSKRGDLRRIPAAFRPSPGVPPLRQAAERGPACGGVADARWRRRFGGAALDRERHRRGDRLVPVLVAEPCRGRRGAGVAAGLEECARSSVPDVPLTSQLGRGRTAGMTQGRPYSLRGDRPRPSARTQKHGEDPSLDPRRCSSWRAPTAGLGNTPGSLPFETQRLLQSCARPASPRLGLPVRGRSSVG
jgi:hypothetical protein